MSSDDDNSDDGSDTILISRPWVAVLVPLVLAVLAVAVAVLYFAARRRRRRLLHNGRLALERDLLEQGTGATASHYRTTSGNALPFPPPSYYGRRPPRIANRWAWTADIRLATPAHSADRDGLDEFGEAPPPYEAPPPPAASHPKADDEGPALPARHASASGEAAAPTVPSSAATAVSLAGLSARPPSYGETTARTAASTAAPAATAIASRQHS